MFGKYFLLYKFPWSAAKTPMFFFRVLIHVQIPSEWWVFIDCSQRSLKSVVLLNENCKASIPIVHSVHLKETYYEMKILLEAI